jgi:Fe-S-cluster-containing hydrogenase component 2
MARELASALALPRVSVRGDSCADCDRDCLEACFNDAIAALPDGGVELVSTSCAGCGACIPSCDRGYIRLAGGVACFVWD